MILTAGLSPAWQQIMLFESLDIGEVNRARDVQWCASGKVINVAIAAQSLGAQTSLLSAVGGFTGQAIQDEIESLGIRTDWLELSEPTRVCTTLLEADGTTTELVENAGPVSETILIEFINRFRIAAQVADVTVLTGSMPANAPEDYYARLVHSMPVRLILDFRGPGLLQCLPFCPFLVKPNREELAVTVGENIENESQLVTAMQRMHQMGAHWVVVSDGPQALYVSEVDHTPLRLSPPQVSVVNPIGCGDCLAAGIAVGIAKGSSTVDAIRLGMGAAAYNAQQLLPGRVNIETAQQLADLVIVDEVDMKGPG